MAGLAIVGTHEPEPDKSVLTAAALAHALVNARRMPVGSEARLGFRAPVPGAVVLVVEIGFFGIGNGGHVHALVPKAQAMNAGLKFGRSQMIHIGISSNP